MVEHYRIWPEGFAAHMRPTDAVDMVFAEECDTRIAELEAENARLRQAASDDEVVIKHFQSERDHLQECLEDVLEQMALSRTGAVKTSIVVLAGIGQYHLENWTDDDFRKHIPAVRAALSDAIARLSALEPAAPEGQQPVAHVIRKGFSSGVLGWTGYGQKADLPDGTMLYTRPAEQAATEAMVEAALNATPYEGSDVTVAEVMAKAGAGTHTMRAALKAAMEAGR